MLATAMATNPQNMGSERSVGAPGDNVTSDDVTFMLSTLAKQQTYHTTIHTTIIQHYNTTNFLQHSTQYSLYADTTQTHFIFSIGISSTVYVCVLL